MNYKIIDNDAFVISFSGDCDKALAGTVQNDIVQQIKASSAHSLIIDGTNIQKWNTLFVALVYEIASFAFENSIQVTYHLPTSVMALIKLAFADNRKPAPVVDKKMSFVERVGSWSLDSYKAFKAGMEFLKDAMASLGRFFKGTAIMRKVDFFFVLEDCSFKALGIVSLICFMVGVIFGFVGAMQLQLFGAQIFVASLVMIAMTRVMGAVMTGIIMAGRTGSAYAATIGTMQVNEEVDALKTMGINVIDFLLLPRMMALIITMPILTVFADVTGVVGGAAVGILMLDLSPAEYWKYSMEMLSLSNFLIGILHGAVFGVVIALCGCYYGIKSGKDANSVGNAATKAVVASIVWIIVSTAVLTLIFQVLGL